MCRHESRRGAGVEGARSRCAGIAWAPWEQDARLQAAFRALVFDGSRQPVGFFTRGSSDCRTRHTTVSQFCANPLLLTTPTCLSTSRIKCTPSELSPSPIFFAQVSHPSAFPTSCAPACRIAAWSWGRCCRWRHYLPAAWGNCFGGDTGKQGGGRCYLVFGGSRQPVGFFTRGSFPLASRQRSIRRHCASWVAAAALTRVYGGIATAPHELKIARLQAVRYAVLWRAAPAQLDLNPR